MGLFSLLLVAVGLAMDAFSVAVTDGIIIQNLRFRNALKIGLYFGIFQAVMPCIGWALGIGFIQYIQGFDHWIAFILLALIGGNMIREALKGEPEEEVKSSRDPLGNKTLFFLAIATSIDALAVGVTFATVGQPILISALIIGLVSLILSVSGVYIGRKFGDLFGGKAEIIGGAVLIGIGLKILIEHLWF